MRCLLHPILLAFTLWSVWLSHCCLRRCHRRCHQKMLSNRDFSENFNRVLTISSILLSARKKNYTNFSTLSLSHLSLRLVFSKKIQNCDWLTCLMNSGKSAPLTLRLRKNSSKKPSFAHDCIQGSNWYSYFTISHNEKRYELEQASKHDNMKMWANHGNCYVHCSGKPIRSFSFHHFSFEKCNFLIFLCTLCFVSYDSGSYTHSTQ